MMGQAWFSEGQRVMLREKTGKWLQGGWDHSGKWLFRSSGRDKCGVGLSRQRILGGVLRVTMGWDALIINVKIII